MTIDWLNVISTIGIFVVFWAVRALIVKQKSEKTFCEEWLRGMGFYYWFTHPKAIMLLTSLPSFIFFMIIFAPVGISGFKGANPLIYPILLVLLIPIISSIIYIFGRKNEKLTKILVYITGTWFVLLIIAVIIAVRGVTLTH